MSIPVYCETCGDVVGVRSAFSRSFTHTGQCPGKGKHPSLITKEKVFFGLVQRVTKTYELSNPSLWYEYVGPSSRLLLILAIIFGTKGGSWSNPKGILINHKWVWWTPKYGLYGEGLEELMKKKQ